MTKLTIHADGICEPNPGKAAWAFIVFDEAGEVLHEDKGYLGDDRTNNYAEYTAVGKAARWCVEFARGKQIELLTDSQLVVNQVNGVWQCQKEQLQTLRDRVKELFEMHEYITLGWIKGTDNQADILTRHAYRDATGIFPLPRVKWKKAA